VSKSIFILGLVLAVSIFGYVKSFAQNTTERRIPETAWIISIRAAILVWARRSVAFQGVNVEYWSTERNTVNAEVAGDYGNTAIGRSYRWMFKRRFF